jgi:hypothetical protein
VKYSLRDTYIEWHSRMLPNQIPPQEGEHSNWANENEGASGNKEIRQGRPVTSTKAEVRVFLKSA